ncbi:hypothetical protein E2C01_079628 [Portunus trituberculatus]|uniref:Uncharacterized protein n=1 Tax=Portunus trituberculatus TaxID=210409 RepID=A0A5B7ITV2_PORTR|nr:hypothetical protein [Portunus trituberculatus]
METRHGTEGVKEIARQFLRFLYFNFFFLFLYGFKITFFRLDSLKLKATDQIYYKSLLQNTQSLPKTLLRTLHLPQSPPPPPPPSPSPSPPPPPPLRVSTGKNPAHITITTTITTTAAITAIITSTAAAITLLCDSLRYISLLSARHGR